LRNGSGVEYSNDKLVTKSRVVVVYRSCYRYRLLTPGDSGGRVNDLVNLSALRCLNVRVQRDEGN